MLSTVHAGGVGNQGNIHVAIRLMMIEVLGWHAAGDSGQAVAALFPPAAPWPPAGIAILYKQLQLQYCIHGSCGMRANLELGFR